MTERPPIVVPLEGAKGQFVFEAIRDGLQSFFVDDRLDDLTDYQVGDTVYLALGEERTSARVIAVRQVVTSTQLVQVVGLDRVWSHASGDLVDDALSAIETRCRRARFLSHTGAPEEILALLREIGDIVASVADAAEKRERRAKIAGYARNVAGGKGPTLAPASSARDVLAWMRWRAPDSPHTGELALMDFSDPVVTLEAWECLARLLKDEHAAKVRTMPKATR